MSKDVQKFMEALKAANNAMDTFKKMCNTEDKAKMFGNSYVPGGVTSEDADVSVRLEETP